MEVLVNIPTDMEDYFQYIPKVMLPEVCACLIRDGIRSRTEIKKETNVDMSMLAQLLCNAGITVGAVPTAIAPTVAEDTYQVPALPEVDTTVEEVSNDIDDEDIDDFMDMLK